MVQVLATTLVVLHGCSAFGTGLGAGIGTLAGGGDIEDALLAGALGYGAGSLASGYFPMAGGAAAKTGATAADASGYKTAAAQAQDMLGALK